MWLKRMYESTNQELVYYIYYLFYLLVKPVLSYFSIKLFTSEKTLCTSNTSTRCCSGSWCVRVPCSFLYKIIYNQHFSLTQAVFKFQSVSLLTSKRPKQLSWETQCDISQKNYKKTITSTVQWILVLLYVNCNHIGACDFKSGLSMFEI